MTPSFERLITTTMLNEFLPDGVKCDIFSQEILGTHTLQLRVSFYSVAELDEAKMMGTTESRLAYLDAKLAEGLEALRSEAKKTLSHP